MKPLNCKLSMGSENLKFHKIISILKTIIINGSWLTWLRWVMDAIAKLQGTWETGVRLANHFTSLFTLLSGLATSFVHPSSITERPHPYTLTKGAFFLEKTWIRILEHKNEFSIFLVARSKNGLGIQNIQTQLGYFRSNLNRDFSMDLQKVYLASSFLVILLFKQIAHNSELKKNSIKKKQNSFIVLWTLQLLL